MPVPRIETNSSEPNAPLRSRFCDDPDMAELVTYFVQEIPQRIEALRDYCESGDREGVQRLAHQLKGSSAGYGFDELGQAAASLSQIEELTDLLRRVQA